MTTEQPSDVQIAQNCKPQPIAKIAEKLGVDPNRIEPYGHFKAKLPIEDFSQLTDFKEKKLILVTAINPTPAGEGKTTVTIGLADALQQKGKRAVVAMREPSLGPVFGIKGGAAGGGYAQVVPMEDINLHFTGDLHAIGAANNLLAALIDNHIYQGNELQIDPKRVTWRRAVDMNDRQLRYITSGLGTYTDGVARPDGFDITVASEIMACFCLADSLTDLKQRLGEIVVGYRFDRSPVFAKDLKAQGALATLLKDALKPNLVQTLEGTPALVHGGPFANIAHGCNSVIATKTAMLHADYTVTEAGFGADLGAEKFCNIKCRSAKLTPDAVVVVATIRALKYNGGVLRKNLNDENVDALREGAENLAKHVENLRDVFGLPVVVAINRFVSDTDNELAALSAYCKEKEIEYSLVEVWGKGGAGALELADAVLQAVEKPKDFRFIYDVNDKIENKIEAIATQIYGADGVDFTGEAKAAIRRFRKYGFDKLPICMAKTQYSFTDDKKRLGRPRGFRITVRDLTVSHGAGFLVALCGDIMKMPGLPKTPAAESIDVDDDGTIRGLF